MTDIPTWRARAEAHPDHQSGMISEGMIRARMEEEIEDLRAEVEQLTRERDEARAEVDRLTRDRRERIATAALQGILACVENGIAPESWADFIPQRAVIYADALIAELDKETKP